MQFKWDIQHTLVMVGSSLLGATVGYLESQQPGTIIDAFSSWATAKPLLHGLLVTDLVALVALAKQTFLTPPPAPPAGGSAAGGSSSTPSGPKSVPPVKLARMVLVAFCLSSVTLTTGCAATNWWQQFQQSPTATIGALVGYVNGFLATAQTIWNSLAPLLGADTPKANAIFNNAMVTAEKALTTLQDAVQAAVIAQTPNPDFSAFVKDLQDAIANVFAVITQWQQPVGMKGAAETMDAMGTLTHQAQYIKSWRQH